jgi:hypothetical protein
MHASKCDYTCVHLTELQLADGACCCVCCIHVDKPWGAMLHMKHVKQSMLLCAGDDHERQHAGVT